ncbi:MAG: hypothetical protein F7B17_03685 [Desulfurococcales archaeon]|nr:hypothetical protein [Desulfurococcales archaeon]
MGNYTLKPELQRALREFLDGKCTLEDLMELVREACRGDARCVNETIKTVLAASITHNTVFKSSKPKRNNVALGEILERVQGVVTETRRRGSVRERRRGGRG